MLEHRLFVWSPLGIAPTAAVIFVLAAGSFFLLAALVHYPVLAPNGFLAARAVPAIAISLLLAVSLGMRRYVDLRQESDAVALSAIVSPGMAGGMPRSVPAAQLVPASIAGAALGVAVTLLSVGGLGVYPAVYAWFAAFDLALGILFGRGVLLTMRNGRMLKEIIDHGLKIELLHADRLAVIGRQCARNALVWCAIAAVVCLFFVSGDSGHTTWPILGVCIGIGVWIFLQPMFGVHHRLRAEKTRELDRIRDEIVRAGEEEARDPRAANCLPGLIALEARIQAVREWPFDQTTLIRVAAYVLIPTIPWFGQAIASDLLARFAR